MGDKSDPRDEQIKTLQSDNEGLQLQVNALVRERDALRDQLAVANHTINPLPAGEIQRPKDLADFKGEYKNLKDGQIYGLKVLPNEEPETDAKGAPVKDADGKPVMRKVNHRGKTHVAKCHTHTWDGTAEEFREQFEKQ